MAIKLREYYQHYRAAVATLFMAAQLLIVLVTGGIGWLLLNYYGLSPEMTLGAGVLVLLLLELAATPFLVKNLSEPVAVLSQAIAHVAKQGGTVPPPDINQPKYERSGLRALVQSVYELAVSGPTDPEAEASKSTQILAPAALRAILAEMPCGLIALHADRSIVFHNDQAPIHETGTGATEVELLFEASQSLHKWLDDCEANKVKDTRVWRRVPNKLPEAEGLRIFDVIAYYTKGDEQGIETIILTVDRTADYAPDQEDMDFIALAAHELRGPITVIRGYLDVLDEELKPVLQSDHHQLIERLRVSADRLSGYVNNILNVSRYDRKHFKLHLHEENIADVMRSLVDDLEMRARTQNRLLGFEVPDDLPTIAADRNSLGEVVSNLVDNAIKYSNEGGQVVVKAAVKGDFVEVTVQDFGIGIPGSVVGNLFSKFYRSHRSRQSVGGTGLGLYISKAIIESHGGSIWVRSTEGQGSLFGFTVPIYATVADKLKTSNNGNEGIIESANGWIRNHSMYRR